MSTLEAVQEILIKEFSLKPVQLVPNAELTSLGIDSLDVLEFMFKVEDRFGLKIKEDIPTTLVTLNDVVVYIDELVLKQSRDAPSQASHVS
jgi:acyl carrier protein